MSISKDEIRRLAELAAIELSEEEVELYSRQISQILEHFDTLKNLDTDKVEPMAHPTNLKNVLRKDIPKPSLPLADALKNAPQEMVSYFQVPLIIE